MAERARGRSKVDHHYQLGSMILNLTSCENSEFPSGPRQCDAHTFILIIYCRGKALECKTRDRRFAPRQRFVFFTRNAFAFNLS